MNERIRELARQATTAAKVGADMERLENELQVSDQSGYEKGFVDGAQHQMKSSVDKAVNSMAQRPWVGLTDDEIKEIVGPWGDTPIKGYTRTLFDQIEAKLREKNT